MNVSKIKREDLTSAVFTDINSYVSFMSYSGYEVTCETSESYIKNQKQMLEDCILTEKEMNKMGLTQKEKEVEKERSEKEIENVINTTKQYLEGYRYVACENGLTNMFTNLKQLKKYMIYKKAYLRA